MLVALGAIMAVSGPFQLKMSTTRGDYFVLTDAPTLSVDPRACEYFLEEIEKKLGVRVPRYTYYRVRTPQDVAVFTLEYADGVARWRSGEVWSVEPCHRHEMVHLASHRLGHPGRFWDEGLAMALDNRLNERRGRRLARHMGPAFGATVAVFSWWVGGVLQDGERMNSYEMAGAFVRHLIRQYNMQKIVEYFRACHVSDEDSSVFHRVFGRTIQEEAERWLR